MAFLQAHILDALILAPLAAVVALLLIGEGNRVAIRVLSVATAALTLLISIWLFFVYDQGSGGFQFVVRHEWVPSLGIAHQVGADGITVAMVMLTAIVYTAGTLVSWFIDSRTKDFYILLHALVAGVFGVFVSLDLFFFYFYYELAVVPMYLLIGFWGSTNREYATMKLTL